MKLHLGCGHRNFGNDWTHIDGGNYEHLHSQNVVNLPFDNDTAEIIYASHLLEYFDMEEGADVLKEWLRVLQPGGRLYVSVPDFAALQRIYLLKIVPDIKTIMGPLFGKMKMKDGYVYHKCVYDKQSLVNTLYAAGFDTVMDRITYKWDKEIPDVDDHSRAHYPHRVENIKTGIFDFDQLPISINLIAQKDYKP